VSLVYFILRLLNLYFHFKRFTDLHFMQTDKESGLPQFLPTKRPFYHGLTFKMSFGLLVFLLLVLSVNFFIAEIRGREVIVQQTDKLNDEIGKTIALSLREKLSVAEGLGRSIATLVEVMDKNPEEYRKIFPQIYNQKGMENMIAGGGIWPEPFDFDSEKERASFFWARNAGGELEFLNDYNDPYGRGYHREEWYVPVRYLEKNQVYWSKSYQDPHSLEPMVTCSVPVWRKGVFKGVVTVDLRLGGLSEFMQEQTKVFGGYAFALDRNDRLLSFPGTAERRLSKFDMVQYAEEAYPTIQALVKSNAALQGVEQELQRASIQHEVNQSFSRVQEVDQLSQKLIRDSDQINLDEARKIARIFLDHKQDKQFASLTKYGRRLTILNDPLLRETSTVSVIHMPDIGWKVVIAMPTRYTNEVVSRITESMMSMLFIFLTIAALLFLLFFNAVFLVPVNQLTQQIRNLVSREDYMTMLNIKGSDELVNLASWFNIRTSQLAEALSSLKVRNGELSEAREFAEQANRSKNIFLASMSHDIRTPMNAIIGLSDVLGKTSLHKDQAHYVQVINSSAQSLLSLINDIMDFSKIEAGQLDLESISFDFRQVLDDCADLIFFQTSEKRLEFIYFVSPNVDRHVIGDPNRLRQIILNLACNAVKFTENGRVELWVELLARQDDSIQLLLEVRDTGIGLSKVAQQKLFEPFVQADSSTTRKYGGTGLGLAICKHLVDLMQGSIHFRSEEGVGTTFSLKIKLACEAKHPKPLTQLKNADLDIVVLGQNHFHNTVVERYINAMGRNVFIVARVQGWLDLLNDFPDRPCITLCTDADLLGDLNVLKEKFTSLAKKIDLICFASQSELNPQSLEKLPPEITFRLISLPLKLDHLELLIRECAEKVPARHIPVEQRLPHAPLSSYAGKNILVVEDNKVNQQVLLIMLGYLGLSADLVNDGVEAVDAVQRNDYDLVLMDWQMPRMDGLEATRKIRLLKDIRQPVIIAVTANAMSGDVEKCLQVGMDDYLSKPIEKDKLERTLRRWLSDQF
jgi:signal transduction histidine kinase/CheY-like chemotaxis protein